MDDSGGFLMPGDTSQNRMGFEGISRASSVYAAYM